MAYKTHRRHRETDRNTDNKIKTANSTHRLIITVLWNVSVLKATSENKTSVTTHFKKLTTKNNVFIVSVIV